MTGRKHSIRTVMLSSSDSTALTLWLNSQTSPHTRSCYRRDAERLLAHVGKPLNDIGLGDLQDFDQSLVKAGLAPVSRVRTLAAVKSLFSFCCRTRYLPANPAAELALPPYEQRLAERIIAEGDRVYQFVSGKDERVGFHRRAQQSGIKMRAFGFIGSSSPRRICHASRSAA